MMLIKVQCTCGQKYAFDVEPLNGRMPQPVKCPVCGADGTAAANEIIARKLAVPVAPRPAAAPGRPPGPPPLPARAPMPPVKKSSALWWTAGALGAVAVAVVFGFLWWPRSPAGSREPVSSTPASAKTAEPAKKAAAPALPPENRYKNQQATLPPEIAAFVSAKEREAEEIVGRQKLELDPDIKNYFTAVLAGHLGAAQSVFHDLATRGQSADGIGQLKGPVWQAIIDVDLTTEALGDSDPDSVLALARVMTNSLTPGCIYFGGTDPGRGLPTMLCAAPGDPFFVVSQNPLADNRYLEYLRGEFGSRIRLPTTNEVQKCFDDYAADAQKRQAANQLIPGEEVRLVDGKPVVQGQVAVMKINGLIAKIVFDRNPDREFFVEESFPLEWMYPYLTPSGVLMRLHHQPLTELSAEDIQQDEDFWSAQMAEKTGLRLTKDTSLAAVCDYATKVFAGRDRSAFKGDARFLASKYSYRAWSKWRSSIAGMYAWRLTQAPPEYEPVKDPQRQEVMDAADLAFRQAFALCPYSPEAVYRYVNFLLQFKRMDDAILVAKTCLACLPKDDPQSSSQQIQALVDQLEKYKTRH